MTKSKLNNLIEISKHFNISENELAVRIIEQIQKENEQPPKTLEEQYNDLDDKYSKLITQYVSLQGKFWKVNFRLREEIGFMEHDKFMEEIE